MNALEHFGRRPAGREYGPLIDVHSHTLLPRFIEALPQGRLFGRVMPPWSVSAHLAMMDATGIQACILSSSGGTDVLGLEGQAARDVARGLNEDLADAVAKHPRRFGAFAVVPLDDMESANLEMAYALDVLKLDGVRASTHTGGRYLGDPYFDAWFAEMNRRKVNLFVHPTKPPGMTQVPLGLNVGILEYMFESTRMVTNMVLSGAKQRFPDVRVIVSHGGGAIPCLATRVSLIEPMLGAGPDRPVMSGEDVLKGFASFYYDLTAATAPAYLDALRHLVPASQLMLGFDYPHMKDTPLWEWFEAYPGLTPEQRRQIVCGTACTLFPEVAKRIGH